MNLETIIQEKVHALPPLKQAKVLAFVEDLAADEEKPVESIEVRASEENEKARLSIIGIGKSGKSDISRRAEEILSAEAQRRSGWSLKDELVD